MSKVAIVLGPDFEDSEFSIPRDRLTQAGHEITILGTQAGTTVSGKRGKERVKIERATGDAGADDFDALVIPGGYSPDHLRLDPEAVRLTKEMAQQGKVVAAVCHGPQLLIEAEVVQERTMTSWPSVRKDLINAGAKWVDREVVRDGNLITSRKPDDLEQFSKAIDVELQRPVAMPRAHHAHA